MKNPAQIATIMIATLGFALFAAGIVMGIHPQKVSADNPGGITVRSCSSHASNAPVTYSTALTVQPGTTPRTPPYPNKGGSWFCPANTVMCGIQSTGLDNHGNIMDNVPICCGLTPQAIGAGLSVSGSGAKIDSSNNSHPVGPCQPGMVVNGVEWAKSNQIDFGYCQKITDAAGQVTWGTPVFVAPSGQNTPAYCPADSLIVEGQNSHGKNDSWNGFYCAKMILPASSDTCSPVPSSWALTGPNSIYTESAVVATYNSLSLGPYNLTSLDNSAGPLYTLNNATRLQIARTAVRPSELTSFMNAFTSVALAKDVCGGSPSAALNIKNLLAGCSNDSASALTITGGNPNAGFVILWDPVAQMAVDPQENALNQDNLATEITVTNSGAPGSVLAWKAAVHYSATTGWLSIAPASGTIENASGNTSAIMTVTANPAGLVNGTYAATLTFTGTSTLTPDTPPQQLTATIVLTVGNSLLSCPGDPACPATPSCSFSAAPSSITLPQTSTLMYDCSNVTACTLGGGEFGSGQALFVGDTNTASGEESIAPKVDTPYSLQCAGMLPQSAYSITKNVTVPVKTAPIEEVNPGRQ